jgi:hypothetical protein
MNPQISMSATGSSGLAAEESGADLAAAVRTVRRGVAPSALLFVVRHAMT